jgi:Ca2+/Na+ antiporter
MPVLPNGKIRRTIAILFVAMATLLFSFIVLKSLGGEPALFMVIGHVSAWGQMVAMYYFTRRTQT